MKQYHSISKTGMSFSDDIIKIGEIAKSSVNETLMNLIKEKCEIGYEDKILTENLYNEEDFIMKLETIAETHPEYAESINEIIAFIRDRELCYVRFATR